jgi:transcription initiation factor TFIIF subunit beta
MERWSAIDAEDVHLASIRVYSEAKNSSGKTPRIMLFLPPNPSDPTAVDDPTRPVFGPNAAYNTNPSDIQPDVYELDMVNDNVENQIVVAERPKVPDPNSTEPHNPRARTTVHTGRVRHNCNLRPVLNATYMRQMKERTRKYNTPHRQIGRIEDAGISGGRGGINMLSSGVGVGSGTAFNNLVVSFFIKFALCFLPDSPA